MSAEYDEYLQNHKLCVRKAYDYLLENGLVEYDLSVQSMIDHHDESKYGEAEYDAYDMYFYEDNDPETRDDVTEYNFLYAFLHHLHNNPHHWQYWVLIQDSDESHKEEVLYMPENAATEMICDWWSFSWSNYMQSHSKQDLYSMFDWWHDNMPNIKLHYDTMQFVLVMMQSIKESLDYDALL